MRPLLTLLLCTCALALNAQFGLSVAVNQPVAKDADMGVVRLVGEEFEPSPEIGLNYWFRLPNQRIEFLPAVYWTTHRQAQEGLPTTGVREFGGQLKVNVYPFDFFGDCGCPTFGKQGSVFKKGFYVQVAGGIALREGLGFPGDTGTRYTRNWTYGGGLGLDIGVSDLLTITPQVNVRKSDRPLFDFDFDRPGLLVYQFGVQATFRLDRDKY